MLYIERRGPEPQLSGNIILILCVHTTLYIIHGINNEFWSLVIEFRHFNAITAVATRWYSTGGDDVSKMTFDHELTKKSFFVVAAAAARLSFFIFSAVVPATTVGDRLFVLPRRKHIIIYYYIHERGCGYRKSDVLERRK